MLNDGRFYLIDFQGGRLGPLQYDLASLLIDPYVDLPMDLQEELLSYAFNRLRSRSAMDREGFYNCYRYLALARNLQALGAYGFLSRVKKKEHFEVYIEPALCGLQNRLHLLADPELRRLTDLVADISQAPGQSMPATDRPGS